MEKYPSYRETGIRWTPNVPSDWNVMRGKQLFYNVKELNKGNVCSNVLSLTLNGVINNNADRPIGLSPQDYATYQIFEKDDLVFKLIDLDNISTSRVGLVHEKGIMSSAYIRLRSRYECNIKFFYYQYYEMYLRNIFNGLGAGVRSTLNAKDLLELPLYIPSKAEQDKIVEFLDWKVSCINRLLGKKRLEIRLLKERREAEINEAVTHGIKKQPLVKSGMNWLPLIPQGWKTVPAKALFDHVVDLRHAGDEMLAATQKYGMIPQREYMELEGRRIVLATDNLDKWLHVEPDEFIISLRSFQGGLELCTRPGCVTWHYVVLRPRENVYVPYFKWLFKSASYIGALQRTSDFIRDGQDLRYSNFVKVRLMFIPMEEQREIADYLERTIPKFDALEQKLQREIELLREMKIRMISDVLTGAIDIRAVSIPYYQASDDTKLEEAASEENDEEE